ncbi:hypothetical protein FC093_23350 [Ilyomonas limi]|uniref:DUF6985 domain-containing protein n=1 Tax=Ilyomonas limi TaxID=2575867 RepID=A0A4V5UTD9_9BACT|nr:hypothetical protein [Ilyomonas limi]TKK64093.1 hypothetical protein FC093_23350 [Ilyomonas limi]
MESLLDLKANSIIGKTYEGVLTLTTWNGYQSRQGHYGTKDKEESSDGTVKVFVKGKSVDNVTISTEQQINAIKYLVDNSEQVRGALLTGLFNKLPELKEIYEELIPNITEIEDFKNFLGLTNLHIMPADKDNFAYIGFELGCDWDEEHGVGVMMHKDRVVAIGQADTSFDSWVTYDDNGTTEIETQKWNEANAKIQAERQPINTKVKPWWKFW